MKLADYQAGLEAAIGEKTPGSPEYKAAVKEYNETHIPMSNLDVDLNAKLNITSDDLTGGGLQNLTIGNAGHLDFADGNEGTLIVNTLHGEGGALSLDVFDDNRMDQFVVLGAADGNIRLGTVNIQSELLEGNDRKVPGKLGDDTEDSDYFGYTDATTNKVIFLDKDGLEINVDYDSNNHKITGDPDEIARLVVNDGDNQVAVWKDLPIGVDNLSIQGTKSVSGRHL